MADHLIILSSPFHSFGAASTAKAHWIAPIIFSSFFSVAAFLLFQSILNYLQDAYPTRAASILAGNDFFRSMMGAAFPLFSPAMFKNLGGEVSLLAVPHYMLTQTLATGPAGFPVFWGCYLLGFISALFLPVPFVLYKCESAVAHKGITC